MILLTTISLVWMDGPMINLRLPSVLGLGAACGVESGTTRLVAASTATRLTSPVSGSCLATRGPAGHAGRKGS